MKGFGPKLKPQYARLVKLAKTVAFQAAGRSSNLLPSTINFWRIILRNKLTTQSKELLNSSLSMRKILSQVFTPDMVDYLMEIIVKNEAHEKFLELTKD